MTTQEKIENLEAMIANLKESEAMSRNIRADLEDAETKMRTVRQDLELRIKQLLEE